MEQEVSELQQQLQICLHELHRRIGLIIWGVFVGLLLAVIIRPLPQANQYGACVTVYNTSFGEYRQALESVMAMKNYTDIVRSYKVCNRAQLFLEDRDLTTEEIQNMIKVDFGEKTYVLSIYAYSEEPEISIAVANAVADSFIVEMQNITGSSTAEVLDEAKKSTLNVDGRKRQVILYVLLALLGGFVSIAVIITSVIFSKKIRCIANCSLNGKLDIIGVIPVIKKR